MLPATVPAAIEQLKMLDLSVWKETADQKKSSKERANSGDKRRLRPLGVWGIGFGYV